MADAHANPLNTVRFRIEVFIPEQRGYAFCYAAIPGAVGLIAAQQAAVEWSQAKSDQGVRLWCYLLVRRHERDKT